MADTPSPDSSSQFGFLTRKVGPLPVWAWGAMVVAAYYWYTHFGPGASKASAQTDTGNGTGDNVTETLTTKTGPTSVTRTRGSNPPPAGGGTPPSPSPPPSGGGSPSPVNEILTGGHVISNNPPVVEIGWTIKQQSPLAQKIRVVLNGPGHKNQTRDIPATATNATFRDLQPGHTYVAQLIPLDAQGQAIGGPNHVTFVTAKASRKIKPPNHTPPKKS